MPSLSTPRALAVLGVFCFFSAILSALFTFQIAPRRPPLGLEIRTSDRASDTLEVWLQDELCAEYQSEDGARFEVLREVMDEAQEEIEP